jgi:hypothetical protein
MLKSPPQADAHDDEQQEREMPLAKKVAAEFVGTFILILMFAVVSKLGSFIHSFTGQLGVEARQTYGEGLEGRQRVPVVHGEHAPLDLAELQDHRVIVRRRRQRYRWPHRSFSDGWSSSLSLPSFF